MFTENHGRVRQRIEQTKQLAGPVVQPLEVIEPQERVGADDRCDRIAPLLHQEPLRREARRTHRGLLVGDLFPGAKPKQQVCLRMLEGDRDVGRGLAGSARLRVRDERAGALSPRREGEPALAAWMAHAGELRYLAAVDRRVGV